LENSIFPVETESNFAAAQERMKLTREHSETEDSHQAPPVDTVTPQTLRLLFEQLAQLIARFDRLEARVSRLEGRFEEITQSRNKWP